MSTKVDLYFLFDSSFSTKDYAEVLNQLSQQIIKRIKDEYEIADFDFYISLLTFNSDFSPESHVLIDHKAIKDLSVDFQRKIEVEGATEPCDAIRYALCRGVERYNSWITSNISCNKPLYFLCSDGYLDYGAYPNRSRDEGKQMMLLRDFYELSDYIRFLEKNNALSFYVLGFDTNTREANSELLSQLTLKPEVHYRKHLAKSFLTDLSCVIDFINDGISDSKENA